MNRKRGHKKGNKPKAPATTAPSEAVVNVVSEENTGNDEYKSGKEVDTPSSTGTDQPLKESLPVAESPCGEDLPLNNSESVDLEEDAEMEDKREVKMDCSEQQCRCSPMEERREEDEEEGEDEDEENEVKILGKGEVESKQQSQLGNSLVEEPIRQSQPEIADKLGATTQSQKGSTPAEREEQSKAVHGKRHKVFQSPASSQHNEIHFLASVLLDNHGGEKFIYTELQDKAKMLNSFYPENSMLLNLCGTLFPNNHKSVWRGPHSLFQRQGSSQTASIQAAMETFMK
ncbi:hypothetical protein SLEP1_g34049 [Rubroshorea leprosula]|uniref:Uncharacterized protein n=1 Tax=Rubroshorea leprosula TaxID=152421 RepID=A0AAV5KIN8_9ROSI|nr:hypothetical protein SLEP1_g34049 [Rubroshorea leprosula]